MCTMTMNSNSNGGSTRSKGGKASATSALVALFRLIEANDWHALTQTFLSDADGARTFQHLAALVANSRSFNGMTILHACARFNPPSALLGRMIELCPASVRARDCLRRTPLHVAAGTGASSSVVKVLVDAYPDAAMVQDRDGRTPLHMACDSSCELFEDDRHPPRAPPSYRTVGLLLSASLESAILEDLDGTSAIEYALCSNADLQTVRLIQRAAQKVRVTMKKEEEANKAKRLEEAKEEASNKAGMAAAAKSFNPRRALLSARTA